MEKLYNKLKDLEISTFFNIENRKIEIRKSEQFSKKSTFNFMSKFQF